MRLKTFSTHTLAIIKDIRAIEASFNVWASKNKNIQIVKIEYDISKRENKNGLKYEEMILFVFYEII